MFSDALESPHSRVKFGSGRTENSDVRTGVPNFSLDGPQYPLANVREIAVGVALKVDADPPRRDRGVYEVIIWA